MSEEEYEGVTLYVEAEGWPSNLWGLIIKEQTVNKEDGRVKIIADPIWNTVEVVDD